MIHTSIALNIFKASLISPSHKKILFIKKIVSVPNTQSKKSNEINKKVFTYWDVELTIRNLTGQFILLCEPLNSVGNNFFI